MSDHLAIAGQLFSAIEAGDVDAVRNLYADNARVWHNSDGVSQTVDENLQVLNWLVTNIRDIQYTGALCQETSRGFVQQHVLRGIKPDGTAFEIPACIVGTIENGKITRIEEYLDSAHVARLA